jgi:Nucleotidyl transferase AbiEii toxin, Type IV TA system
VSGERILLADGADGHVADLVRAASLVAEHARVPIALIGGLAVACRLATAHRATQDVDIVADESANIVSVEATAAEHLVAAGVAQRATDTTSVRLYIAGTRVEIIETTRLNPSDAADIDPEDDRLFVLAHRWALETATECTLVVGSNSPVTLPVARPAALVAMKVHAIEDRTDDRKRASDAWDLFRLLDAHNSQGDLTAALAAGPEGLDVLVAKAIDRVFRIDVTRTRHWIRGYGEPAWVEVLTDDALSDVGAELVNGLRSPGR